MRWSGDTVTRLGYAGERVIRELLAARDMEFAQRRLTLVAGIAQIQRDAKRLHGVAASVRQVRRIVWHARAMGDLNYWNGMSRTPYWMTRGVELEARRRENQRRMMRSQRNTRPRLV